MSFNSLNVKTKQKNKHGIVSIIIQRNLKIRVNSCVSRASRRQNLQAVADICLSAQHSTVVFLKDRLVNGLCHRIQRVHHAAVDTNDTEPSFGVSRHRLSRDFNRRVSAAAKSVSHNRILIQLSGISDDDNKLQPSFESADTG